MIDRSKLRELYPEYDNMSAIDKIAVERYHGTKSSLYRNNVEKPLEIILGLGFPAGLYFLSSNGYAPPDPGVGNYVFGAVLGLFTGKALGLAVGTIMYELMEKDGELNQAYQKIKNNFNRTD